MPDQHQSTGEKLPAAPCPSPWHHMKADVFFALGWMSSANELPAGSYGPVEEHSTFKDQSVNGKYTGGWGTCMIVKYSQTPVGPYDEVIWIPGSYETPPLEGTRMVRISRIYVSTVESVYNGRRNWNIPKELAHFKFHPADNTQSPYPPYKKVEISPYNSPSTPFISINLTPITLLSRPILPISTSYIPMNMDIAMPPLPQSETWRERDDGRVGTDKWHVSSVNISGKVGVIGVDGKLGDGVGFPVMDIGRWGWFWVKDADMEFVEVDGDYGLN